MCCNSYEWIYWRWTWISKDDKDIIIESDNVIDNMESKEEVKEENIKKLSIRYRWN